MANTIFKIEKTKIDTIIKLVTDDIIVEGSYQYNNIDEAKESPLAQQLFYLPFIKRVFISANFIALERFSIVSWSDVENEVKEQIENFINSGGELVQNASAKKSPIEIYAEVTPNPHVLKFVANKLLVEQDLEYKNIEEAKNSQLATELFNFPFVKEVFISENYVSITKFNVVEWNEITSEIRGFIRNFISDGKQIVQISSNYENLEEGEMIEENVEKLDEVSQRIIAILDEHIRPAVASDGGNIMFESYNSETQNVHVVLQGACSGCPSSTITLKNGIENMLKQLIPGKINEVVAVNQ
jgi:Fe-S cluster biogenesis protein NfuA